MLALVTIFISIGWYGNLSEIKEVKVSYKRYEMSYEDAKSTLAKPVYPSKSYHYIKGTVNTYKRTLIPFKYEKYKSEDYKQYYSN